MLASACVLNCSAVAAQYVQDVLDAPQYRSSTGDGRPSHADAHGGANR